MNKFFDYRFEGQEEGEEILVVLRRNWFNILVQFIPVLVLTAILFLSLFFLPSIFQILKDPALQNFFYFLESLLAMFICILFFLIWVDYYLDTWIITDRKIVNIEQKGLFSRTTSELAMDKIQDITTEVTGMFPTLVNYGDVFVQTAAEKERFIFRKVSNPYKIKDLLMSLQKEKEHEKAQQFEHMIHEELT
jgi:uncharacterized membrane protein YdbT with pleckstrin-like domain